MANVSLCYTPGAFLQAGEAQQAAASTAALGAAATANVGAAAGTMSIGKWMGMFMIGEVLAIGLAVALFALIRPAQVPWAGRVLNVEEDSDGSDSPKRPKEPLRLSKYLAEFFGTFFLTLAATDMMSGKDGPTPEPHKLGIVATLAVGVYAFGDVSGGHLNPAVSLGLYCRGAVGSFVDVLIYWAVQFVGAVSAALIHGSILGQYDAPSSPHYVGSSYTAFHWFKYLTKEIFNTMLFVLLICTIATSTVNVSKTETLHRADSKAFVVVTKLDSFFGLMIGFYVTVAMAICGASLNPAVTVGADLV